jgi:HD superfamily phosphohydrolase
LTLEERINTFVEDTLSDFIPNPVRDQKVIHERVWGTNLYLRHEIAMLDTPLLQRLRQIHQTGLVFFTYPSALHTRFDHTLGCMSLVSRFVRSLKAKQDKTEITINDSPEKGDLAALRMAALLHDWRYCQ